SPGFATFTVDPHPSGLTSASGVVPTPHGPINVAWQQNGSGLSLQVTAPPGTIWQNSPSLQSGPPAPVAAPAMAVVPGAAARDFSKRLGSRLRSMWRFAGW